MAARRIQAAARGFLARRRVDRMRRPRLMSPMDIGKIRGKPRRKQGQIKDTSRGVMPKYRIGSLIGTAKSSRKVSGKMDVMSITEHRDVHATVNQAMVAYWGYSDAGSCDDQLEMGTRALVNMFVRKSGLKPTSVYQSFDESYLQDILNSDIKLKRIAIAFQGINVGGGISRDESYFAVADTDSVHLLTQTIMAELKAKANTNEFKPVRAILQSFVSGTYTTFATFDLENTMIDFSYMRKYKWQNVTPADTTQAPGEFNQFSVNDINANPLSGMIYQYKHAVPQVRGAKLDNADLPQLQKIQTINATDGALDCTAFRNGDYNSLLEFPFKQPYKSMELFKDTLSQDKVYMPPGGYKQLIRKGTKTMNFSRFCQATIIRPTGILNNAIRTSSGADIEPRIGTSTIWGLEPVIRTTTNEVVRVATQMETWYTAKARPGTKSVPIAKINSVTAGTNFLS